MTRKCSALFLSLLFLSIISAHAQYSIWTWGDNVFAQRGDGKRHYDLSYVPPATTVPAPVTCYGDWKAVATGDFVTLALRQDGTLWAWGTGRGLGLTAAQLDHAGTNNSLPAMAVAAQVGTDQNWASASTSGHSTAALKTNGTLWTWGTNQLGQLGDGSNIARELPAQVGSATNWKQVANVGTTTLALQTDGTLWAWGYGFLRGNGTLDAVNVPTRTGTATDWRILGELSAVTSMAAAIKTDGSLWVWGDNDFGELGLGAAQIGQEQLLPQRVGTGTDWKSVSTGSQFTVALKTDGSLWTWGHNNLGQLGDGTTTDRSVPTRVGAATDWAQVSAGDGFALAVKTDGSLWAWGANPDGAPAYGNTPQRIGTSNSWKRAYAGLNFAIALHDSPHNPIPVPVTLGDDFTICQSFANLASSITTADSYTWRLPDNNLMRMDGGNGTAVAALSGTYKVTVSLAGCRSKDEIQVGLFNPPKVAIAVQGTQVANCANNFEIGTPITFQNTTADAASHQFTWDVDGTTMTEASPTLTFTDPGYHFISLSTNTPCPRAAYKTVIVQSVASIGPPVIEACQLPITLSSNITDADFHNWITPDGINYDQPTLEVTKSGRYVLDIQRYGCDQIAVVNVSLAGAQPLSFAPQGTAIPNCPGHYSLAQPITFDNTTPEAGTQAFTWTMGNGTTLTDVSPAYTYPAAGHYTVTLNGSCSRTLTQDIYVQPMLSLGDDIFACQPSVTLTADIPGADTYTWQTPGGTITGQPSITATSSGTYEVTVASLGCTQTDAMEITTSPFAVKTDFDILAAGEAIAPGGVVLNGVTLTFIADGRPELQRTWTLGDGTTAQGLSLQHTYTAPGDYVVKLTVTDGAGCTGTGEKSLHIEDIIITEAISPNGDGKNDRLVVTPFLYDAELKVVDRNGRVVFQAAPYHNDFSGQNLESDIYYYELQFKEAGKSYKGFVHIVK